MNGNKLEISGKPVKDHSSSTYKQVSDSDLEGDTINKSKNSSKIASSEKDGAHEKMLPEAESKIGDNSSVNTTDVKFISKEKQNGDAKVDIGDLKTAFVGMGKEELMKYANDPFWVRLRWFLFILFWLVWVGMLVGAILIIVAAPKCSPPEPRTWWEEGPLIELEKYLTCEELSEIKEDGIQGVIVAWPEDAYISYNYTHQYISFLERTLNTKVNVIVDLKPGVSTKWFELSQNNDSYMDYYIWAPPSGFNGSGAPLEPNNWKSKQNSSSWKYSLQRNKFYLSDEEAPKLNFNNPLVVNEFSMVISNLLEAGAKGIRLTGAPYLLIDGELKDDGISGLPGFGLTDYGFYTHTNTEYLSGLGPLLKQWRDIVKSKTNGPFMLSENLRNLDVFKVNNSLMIDLPFRPRIFGPNKQLVAAQINADLNAAFLFLENKYWPLWQHNNSALPRDVLDIITLLLPGTTLIDRNFTIAEDLLSIRKANSIMHGNTSLHLFANKTVLVFGRLTPGNPGYLVALNPTINRIVIDLPSEILTVSEEVTIQLFSKNYNETDMTVKAKADAHKIPISPESALVLSYVPKS